MKQIVLFGLALSISICMKAQDKFQFSGIVRIDSATKEQLSEIGRAWSEENMKAAPKEKDITDQQAVEISDTGSIKYFTSISALGGVSGRITFSVKIKVKDRKYKYEFSDFVHEAEQEGSCKVNFGSITTAVEPPDLHYSFVCNGNKRWRAKVWNDIKAEISRYVNEMIASLNAKMDVMPEKNF